MTRGTVVLVGRISVEHLVPDDLAAEFGWCFQQADNLSRLAELNERHDIVTVLFSPKYLELPWDQALRCTMDAVPNALPILCHGFAEMIDWPQVAEAGAFHSLLIPLKLQELRQSLGFAKSAKRRDATIPPRNGSQVLQRHAYAAGTVG